ncbi:AraC family transcriptional regulator [Vitiosangium sp. GDMCC 1.1324]|uniref:helix-turn-helix transcriptional regulator n=1 Tax=Vitiosangium sp. (strain GDMCC 1.1324) TaxID=2138576 RepID=UPI000D35AC41|nr:AraC family transcriptional regulator [Vitiosangium sp. GDMCC 1.1324]PTL84909.1 AraC family transcriptional regulator [Vitiosangium sp. GDMCC 1.1324]
MAATRTWRGRLFFGPGRLLYAGPVGETRLHAHHSFQLVLSLGEPVVLGDSHQRTRACQAAIIPPDVGHAVVGMASAAVLLHASPDDLAGRSLRALGTTGEGVEDWRRAGEHLLSLTSAALPRSWHEAESLTQAMLAALRVDTVSPRPAHPAVKRLLRLLPESLDGDVRLETLAHQLGLSASRLSHLFSAEVGLPLRPYILWLRLHRAAEHLRAGAPLTSAAHAAGFTDSAHLSHVFRRMFGLSPSEIAGVVEWVLPPRDSGFLQARGAPLA